MTPNAPASTEREFARVVAFANLQLPPRFPLKELGRQNPESQPVPHACSYNPYVDELTRALRVNTFPKWAEHDDDAFDLWCAYRPLYGFRSRRAVTDCQNDIRLILDGIINADPGPLQTAMRDLKVSLDAVYLVPDKLTQRGHPAGKTFRALRQPFQMSVQHYVIGAKDSIVYGIARAAMKNLLARLSKCEHCDRFILARTDRRVRVCAHHECRIGTVEVGGTTSTKAAEYQRRRRSRIRTWQAFSRRLRKVVYDATQASTPGEKLAAASALEHILQEGRKLLDACYPKKGSAHRPDAIASIESAETLLNTLRANVDAS